MMEMETEHNSNADLLSYLHSLIREIDESRREAEEADKRAAIEIAKRDAARQKSEPLKIAAEHACRHLEKLGMRIPELDWRKDVPTAIQPTSAAVDDTSNVSTPFTKGVIVLRSGAKRTKALETLARFTENGRDVPVRDVVKASGLAGNLVANAFYKDLSRGLVAKSARGYRLTDLGFEFLYHIGSPLGRPPKQTPDPQSEGPASV